MLIFISTICTIEGKPSFYHEVYTGYSWVTLGPKVEVIDGTPPHPSKNGALQLMFKVAHVVNLKLVFTN